jgi:hypothetical protein
MIKNKEIGLRLSTEKQGKDAEALSKEYNTGYVVKLSLWIIICSFNFGMG